MAFLSQLLTRSSLYEQPMITIQHLAFEILPFCASADDYDIDAHTFSAYGTSTDGVLRLRRPKRLVVSRPKKPRKAVLRKAWPDPRNAKEVASFHQKYLASRHDSHLQTTHTVYTHRPQSVHCTSAGSLTVNSIRLITSAKTVPTSNRVSKRVMPPPPRFARHANEI